MRRITLWIVSTVAVLVLLFSYRTSTSGPAAPATAVVAPAAAPAGIVTDPAPSSSGTSKAQPSQAAAKTVTVNGPAVDTRWGPVQVRVAIANGKITEVTVLQQPSSNRRDEEINAYALPQLREQVLSAQSAQIDGVSGATVTSDGYRESLQQALDTAHFGS